MLNAGIRVAMCGAVFREKLKFLLNFPKTSHFLEEFYKVGNYFFSTVEALLFMRNQHFSDSPQRSTGKIWPVAAF